MKIDVEGAELLVLEGALETLREARCVVAVEHVWHEQQSGELYNLLSGELRLRAFDMDGRGPLTRSEFLESSEKGDRWNWIFHE